MSTGKTDPQLPPIPQAFIDRMDGELPFDTDRVIEALQTAPLTSIKINWRKSGASTLEEWNNLPEEARIEYASKVTGCEGLPPVKWCRSGFYLPERPLFTLNPLLHGGVFYVQEAASMIYELIADHIYPMAVSEQPLRVADLCAAPGGKTTSLINALPEGGTILANEYVRQRAGALRENLIKWGYPSVIVTNSSTEGLAKSGVRYDVIAVDAPCSGEGMMRKEAEARRQWTPQLVEDCAKLQRSILRNAVDMLRPGGYLIYSTCTFNTAENEENVRWLRDELGMAPFAIPVPEGSGILTSVYDDIPAMRFMPGYTDSEGLFVAVMRKEESDAAIIDIVPMNEGRPSKASKKGAKVNGNRRNATNDRQHSAAPDWKYLMDAPGDFVEDLTKDTLYLHPLSVEEMLPEVRKNANVILAGIEAMRFKGKDAVPTTELVLSTATRPDALPVVEVDKETALRYLRREAIVLPEDSPRGVVTIAYEGHALGTAKNLGTRANNLYPAEWKIRIGID